MSIQLASIMKSCLVIKHRSALRAQMSQATNSVKKLESLTQAFSLYAAYMRLMLYRIRISKLIFVNIDLLSNH